MSKLLLHNLRSILPLYYPNPYMVAYYESTSDSRAEISLIVSLKLIYSLFYGVFKLGEWEKTTRLLNEMVSKGIFPNVCTFNVLIDTLCKHGTVRKAKRGMNKANKVLELTLCNGYMVDAYSYNILINSYYKHKGWMRPGSVFFKMSRKGVVPDTVEFASSTGTTTKKSSASSGAAELATSLSLILASSMRLNRRKTRSRQLSQESLFRFRGDKGSTLSSSNLSRLNVSNRSLGSKSEVKKKEAASYSRIGFGMDGIRNRESFVQAEKVGYAWDLFRSLSSKGIQLDVKTYTIMISGFCNGELTSEAENLLRQMEEKYCSPNGCMYNTIIQRLLNNNETSMAVRLIQQMV
ncbi:hypothetical protein ACFX10_029525 [Malus domestica]